MPSVRSQRAYSTVLPVEAHPHPKKDKKNKVRERTGWGCISVFNFIYYSFMVSYFVYTYYTLNIYTKYILKEFTDYKLINLNSPTTTTTPLLHYEAASSSSLFTISLIYRSVN